MPEIKENKFISIIGARQNNLKNISLQIPRNSITVITGVSGSGKSSLAFDTIYAEGQRRFVESLSAYARQFLERMQKPDVDSISGLPPAIAIEQKPPSKNPRSTVGTVTEIYDYLRLLFGRIGITICKSCGKQVKKDTPESVVNDIKQLANNGDKIYILFKLQPQIRNLKSELQRYKESGFYRILIGKSNEIIDLNIQSIPDDTDLNDVLILADRLIYDNEVDTISRLTDSVESAFSSGFGKIIIRNLTQGIEHKYSNIYECAECDIVYLEPEPRLFAFNTPFGACPHCQGFGRTIGIDENLVIPEPHKSLSELAIHPFRTPAFMHHQRALVKVATKLGIPLNIPYHQLSEKHKQIIWDGYDTYIGINGYFNMLEEKSYKMNYRILLSRYRGYTNCRHCGGSRIRTSARQVYVNGINIPQLVKLPIDKLHNFFENLELDDYKLKIVGNVINQIKWRLRLLIDIGLEYLSLDRLMHTLSGGEAQRINLATALGSSLVGTLYVLDEPSIGLHSRDTDRLINILKRLKSLGNTVVVVEHDPDIIKSADFIIDLGPLAGEKGGEVVFAGSPDEICKNPNSLTGRYICNSINTDGNKNYKPNFKNWLTIYEPKKYNLKMDKVRIPLNCITAITGVSGSGKSTLVYEILYPALKRSYISETGYYKGIKGGEIITHVEMVDQSPIGKSSRSTPATYTKAFDAIREIFAQTPMARQLGWKPGHFSFNVPGGRCDVCDGEGTVSVDMQFLPDVILECEACKGTRYKREVRNVLFKGKSIVDVLNMTVDEALEFFDGHSKVTKKLKILSEVGLGYLKLGQPSVMLSGGESQRIKLANHLDIISDNHTLFIFDEPTTGLHLHDIEKLLACFEKLVLAGNSILIIEHNLKVISYADWIIDLGPEAGDKGGYVIAEGTPEKIAQNEKSYTGIALKKYFENKNFISINI